MTQKFTIETGNWYGWVEVPARLAGFCASPIFVAEVQPLKTGSGFLKLGFLHPLLPRGGQRRSLSIKVIQNLGSHIVASYKEGDALRTAILCEVTFDWMASYCSEHLRRRPPAFCSLTMDGAPLYEITVTDHLTAAFGRTKADILVGATSESFSCEKPPFPDLSALFFLDETYSPFDSLMISRGFVPHVQEEKWFVCLENGYLMFRRSWTGFMIYHVEAVWRGDSLYLGQVNVNRDPEQYTETDSNYDKALLQYVIRAVLLGLPADFPLKEGAEGSHPLQAWSMVGKASIIE